MSWKDLEAGMVDGREKNRRANVLSCLVEEEAGDARLFAELFKGKLLFDASSDTWHEFEDGFWKPLLTPPYARIHGSVASTYLRVASDLQKEVETAEDEERNKLTRQVGELIGRAKKLRALTRVNHVLTFAQEHLGTDGSEWDQNPWLLGVKNGVLDLKTGQLRPGRPEDMIRIVAPTLWKGLDEPCPRFEQFVSEIMSDEADRVAFLHRLLGYSLNGVTSEHILVILVGSRGRNGKGVLCETIQAVLGEYAGTASTDIVIGQDKGRTAGSAQPHLMSLMGKRFITTSETEEYAQLSVAQVKHITGGDSINARPLYGKPVTFKPSHTIFLQTNRKPQAPADDDALWERVRVIEFKTRFVDEPQSLDERPRDPNLLESLRQEQSGILAWLVRGHLAWLNEDGLQTPASVKLAKETYRKEESIEPFIADCCVVYHEARVAAGKLYNAYKDWCSRSGLRPKSPNWLASQMGRQFQKARSGAGGQMEYHGIGLKAHNLTEYPFGATEGAFSSDAGAGFGFPMPSFSLEGQGRTASTEGSTSTSKTFLENFPREGKFMEGYSVPSVASVEPSPDETLPPGFREPQPSPRGWWITNGQGFGDYAPTREEAIALAWRHTIEVEAEVWKHSQAAD